MYYLIFIVVLVYINYHFNRPIENFYNAKETIETFNANFTNSSLINKGNETYKLKDSRLGKVENLGRILSDKKTLKNWRQIQRQFPLNVRFPLMQSSVSETPQDPKLLRKGGLSDETINQFIPSSSRKGRYKQREIRKAVHNPTPFNENFKDSSGSRNFILTQPERYNTNLLLAFDNLKKRNGITANELIGTEWQDQETFNFFTNTEIQKVINNFITILNNELKKITGKKGSFTYLDKEEAKVEKSYPILNVNLPNSNKSNLNKEYTRYTIIFYIQDQDALLNRGIKGVFVSESKKKPRVFSLEIVGQKGDITKGIDGNPEYYEFGGKSRDTQKVTQSDIDRILKEKEKQRTTPEFTCFGGGTFSSSGTFGNEQISRIDRDSCEKSGGFLDTPVKNNEECPFYKSNKNYNNNRGGVRGGFCELPVGMNLIGFRRQDPNGGKPKCYNCIEGEFGRKSIGECCEEQANDRDNYPTLKSPDYVFPSDELDRFYNRNQLHALDLSWNKKGFASESELPTGVSDSAYLVFNPDSLPARSLSQGI